MLFQLLAMCEEVTVEEVLKLVDAHLQPHKGIRGTVSIVVSFLFSLSLINHSLSVIIPSQSLPFCLPIHFSCLIVTYTQCRRKKVSILAVSLHYLPSFSLED